MKKHNSLGYHVRILWVRRCGRSTHLDLVQGSAQLREAFPALAPDTEHASLLWRRRCRACEKVTQAMATVPLASGAPARAALKTSCCLCMGYAEGSHAPNSWMLDIRHQSIVVCTKDKAGLPLHELYSGTAACPVQTMTAELKHMGAQAASVHQEVSLAVSLCHTCCVGYR